MALSKVSKPIAYLASQYPAVSHTFILREVEALKALGLDIRPCSIRRPPASHLTGTPEQNAAKQTFYVLDAARNPMTLLGAQLAALKKSPRRYFQSLWLALKTSSPGLRAHFYQILYFIEATVLARHLQKNNISHLHNHFANASANVAMLAAKLADIPYSLTLHGPADFFEPYRLHLREKIDHAAFVSCISFFCRSQAMYFSDPSNWHKLKIIHCGVVPQLYVRPDSRNDTQEKIGLIFIGRLDAVKGIRLLLEAFGTVRKTHPNLHLTVVGDGAERLELEMLAGPFKEAVHFAGYQSQDAIADLLAQSNIMVLPSFAEGVPVVLMEAMASGIPVISSLVAGIPELVEDGVSGFLVSPGDTETLVKRISELAADPARRANMGAVGRAKVQSDFNIQIEAARLASLFLESASQDGVRPTPLTGQ